MEPLRRRSLVDDVELALRKSLDEGRWRDELPGLRVLARALEVSVPTIRNATDRLIAAGLLARSGDRRRLRILKASSAPDHTADRRLLFITPEKLPGMIHDVSEILASLAPGIAGAGWSLHHRPMGYGHGQRRVRQWDRLFATEKPGAVIVWTPRPALTEWLAEHAPPCLLLGGTLGTAPVPMLAVNSGVMVERAMNELLALGHRRILLPLVNRSELMIERQRKVMSDCLARVGAPFSPPSQTPVSSEDHGAVIESLIERAWHDWRPTALILFDWREFVAVSCFLRDRGVRIPEDLSVVLLSHDPAMAWHRPGLTHFRIPNQRFAAEIRRWVLAADAERWTGRRSVRPVWTPGESVAPPRA